jgi:hypothetical protein
MHNYHIHWGQNSWWIFWRAVQTNVKTISLENSKIYLSNAFCSMRDMTYYALLFMSVYQIIYMVSQVRCLGKHRCLLITKHGSLVAWVDLKTQEKTRRCILVQAIRALCQAVIVLCVRGHPNGGYNERERDLAGDRSVLSYAHQQRDWFPDEEEERSSLSRDFRGEDRSAVPLCLLCLWGSLSTMVCSL